MEFPDQFDAYYSARYGWTLKKKTEISVNTCKNCEHGCHCSNGGSCQSCDCKNCEHDID